VTVRKAPVSGDGSRVGGRAALGEAAFAAAWAEGRAMSLDQAVEYALEGSQAAAPVA
jgi:hypothetical protein